MSDPPRELGDYLRGERLGAGGMGAVYRARHRVTGAEYALKVTRLDDPELAERFAREGQALGTLEHPNVVRVHSAGAADGWQFLVQELIPGEDLQARLRRGPLPPEEARALAIALGEGLAHAHAQGVIHRDLKPANVLLGADGRPRLVDFGLARVADRSSLTETGTVMGSPNWMAPEQANGQPADARSDVYGLGAVLYHALTGRPPAEGGSVLAVLQAALETAPPAPRSLVPAVPRALEAVCLRALAKDPAARYPSAEAFVAALVAAEGEGRRGSPGLALAGGALIVALALGAGLAWRASSASAPLAGTPKASASPTPSPAAPTPTPSAAAEPGRPKAGEPGDAALWRRAREGETQACVALGLGLAAADRPVEAARWLKRGDAALWRQRRGALLRAAAAQRERDLRDAPLRRRFVLALDLVWTLITPPEQDYPTPERPLTTDATEREEAQRLLTWLRNHKGRDDFQRPDVAPLLDYLRSGQAPPRAISTTQPSYHYEHLITRFPPLNFFLRRLSYAQARPGLERQKIGRGYGDLCHFRFPRVALKVYRDLGTDPTAPIELRQIAWTRILWISQHGSPDLRPAPRALFADAQQAARLGNGEGLSVYVRALRERLGVLPPETIRDLRRLFEATSPPQRPWRARVEWAWVLLQAPEPDRLRAQHQLQRAASTLHRVGRSEDLAHALEVWKQAGALAPELQRDLERALDRTPSERQRAALRRLLQRAVAGR